MATTLASSIPHPTMLTSPSQSNFSTFLIFWEFLLSSTALREGAKLLLVGTIMELTRRIAAVAWTSFIESFFITAEFEDRDETFTWMMFWLSRHPRWNNLRKIRVSTFRYGQGGVSNVVPGEEEGRMDPSRRLAYVPSHNETLSMWYGWTWMSVTLVQTQGDMWNRRGDERLNITLFTRSVSTLDELLLKAKQSYKKHSEGRINIYVSDGNNDWTLTGSRPRRPLKSVVLDRQTKESILADAKDFMASEKWYADRGIPWRRGYLLYGSPGSGKTSLIHSLAGELGLDVYVVALSKKTLDDTTLNELISKIPPKSIALMEDIDVAFHRGVTRENASTGVPLMPGQPPGEFSTTIDPMTLSSQMPMQSASGVTLSGLLGAIDGVAAQEGRLLFATTNKYPALDPALIRPGRLDVHIRFENASKRQAAELFRCFFPPASEDDDENESSEGSDNNDDPCPDETESPTAVNSPSESPTSLLLEESCMRNALTGTNSSGPCSRLSRKDIKRLSAAFAKRIPEGEFSMASLQGFLMKYKTSPHDAVRDVALWVVEERHKRAEREGVA